MRLGLSAKERAAGYAPHTFFDLAGTRIGVYLQSEERAPAASAHGAPTYSLVTTPNGIDGVIRGAERFGDAGDRREAELFFADPAGNWFHLCVAESDVRDSGERVVGSAICNSKHPNSRHRCTFTSAPSASTLPPTERVPGAMRARRCSSCRADSSRAHRDAVCAERVGLTAAMLQVHISRLRASDRRDVANAYVAWGSPSATAVRS